MRILHLINPYEGGNKNEQEIVLQSLVHACSQSCPSIEVTIAAIVHKEDSPKMPDAIQNLHYLERFVDQVANLSIPSTKPLLRDIFNFLNSYNADYIVYTNMDIGVMPFFYDSIKSIIEKGMDAFIINRRRVAPQAISNPSLHNYYSDLGAMHNGYDCFVFKKEIAKMLDLGDVCVGVPHVGNSLAFNLMCHAKSFKLYTSLHLTFHIGYELVRDWGDADIRNHNKSEYLKIIRRQRSKLKLANMPGSGLAFFKRHFKWLMNPTIHYPTFALTDFKQWSEQRYEQNKKAIQSFNYFEWLQEKVRLDN
ncbi:MAG: hypothetical protein WBA16_08960 [Nonlabens sp.]